MAWVPAAIGAGGSILGGLLGNKGAKQQGQQAADAQSQLTQQMFQQAIQYQNQQEQALRNAISGLGPNPFFGAPPHPQQISPFQNATQFGGNPPPGTFAMSHPSNKGPQPQNPGNKQQGTAQGGPWGNGPMPPWYANGVAGGWITNNGGGQGGGAPTPPLSTPLPIISHPGGVRTPLPIITHPGGPITGLPPDGSHTILPIIHRGVPSAGSAQPPVYGDGGIGAFPGEPRQPGV